MRARAPRPGFELLDPRGALIAAPRGTNGNYRHSAASSATGRRRGGPALACILRPRKESPGEGPGRFNPGNRGLALSAVHTSAGGWGHTRPGAAPVSG